MLSALVFNFSLFAMPFAALGVWQGLQSADVYGYDVTDAAKSATKRALEEAAASLIPGDADRAAYWSSLVQREIEENDFSAARGFLLAAPKMLPPEDAARLEGQLPTGADDEAVAQAALAFLDPEVQRRYLAGISAWGAASRGARDAIQGAVTGRADTTGQLAGAVASDFFVLGDLRDIAIQGGNWVSDKPVDVFVLALSGVGVALTATTVATAGGSAPLKVGASVIKAAKRAGRLSAGFAAHIERTLFEAVPPARLKDALARNLSAPTLLGDRSRAVTRAFETSVDPAGYAKLRDQLDDVRAVSGAVSPLGAVRLLEHAEDATDLKRLRLVAEAGGDRAIAVAKRGGGLKMLRAAKGTLKMTHKLSVDLAGLFASVLLFLASVLGTLVQALARALRRREPPEPIQERPEALSV